MNGVFIIRVTVNVALCPFCRKRKMSGFGHRVYKNYDPRAKVRCLDKVNSNEHTCILRLSEKEHRWEMKNQVPAVLYEEGIVQEEQ